MTKIISLADHVQQRAVERVQKLWLTRFPEQLTAKTRLADLSDRTVHTLAQLGGEMMELINDLVIGILSVKPGLKPGMKFQDLSEAPKLEILDVSLFLIDQIRWECMGRLGWIMGYAAEVYPLVDLILRSREIKAEFAPKFPSLVETHSQYHEFVKRKNLDGEVVIRKLIPAALAAFAQRF